MVENARALLDAEACAPLLIITSPPWGVMDGCDHDIALEDGEVKVLTEHAQRQMYKHNKHTHTDTGCVVQVACMRMSELGQLQHYGNATIALHLGDFRMANTYDAYLAERGWKFMQVIVVAAEGGQTTWNPNSRTHAPIRTSHYYIWKRNNAKTVVHEMPEEEDSGGKGTDEKKLKAARVRQAEVADRKTQNSFLFLRY